MSKQNDGVLIVGAGAAGLAAAARLQAHGYVVTILEARSRVGGRVHTVAVDVPFASGTRRVFVDLGATFHYAGHNPIHAAALKHNVRLVEADSDDAPTEDALLFSYKESAYTPLDRLAYLRALKRYEWMSDEYLDTEATKGLKSPMAQLSLGEALDRAARTSETDVCPLGRMDRDEQLALQWIIDRLRMSLGMSPYRMPWYEDSRLPDDGVAGEFMPVQGMQTLLNAMVWDQLHPDVATSGEDMPRAMSMLNISLGQEVTSIEHSASGVSVTTRDGQRYQAKRCILTVPIPLLKNESVVLKPPLPVAKRKLLQSVYMSQLNIVCLFFEKVFWPDVMWFGLAKLRNGPDDTSPNYSFLNGTKLRADGIPLLIVQAADEFSLLLEQMEDDEVIDTFMTPLRRMFSVDVPAKPLAMVRSSWASYKYSGGAFCATDTDAMVALAGPANPWGTLLLAGEGTHWGATVNGAVSSGFREAERVRHLDGHKAAAFDDGKHFGGFLSKRRHMQPGAIVSKL